MKTAMAVANAEYNEYMSAAESAARLVQERIGALLPTENTQPTLLPKVG